MSPWMAKALPHQSSGECSQGPTPGEWRTGWVTETVTVVLWLQPFTSLPHANSRIHILCPPLAPQPHNHGVCQESKTLWSARGPNPATPAPETYKLSRKLSAFHTARSAPIALPSWICGLEMSSPLGELASNQQNMALLRGCDFCD